MPEIVKKPAPFEMPELPAGMIIELTQGGKKRLYITAEGLIYLAHLQGLERVDVRMIHEPTKDDATCIVFCEVKTSLGTFSDYGEVNPANKGQVGGSYPLSMATTRARNRALRIATKCPITSYEEMHFDRQLHEGDNEGMVEPMAPSPAAEKPKPARPATVEPPKPTAERLAVLHALEDELGHERSVPGPNSSAATTEVVIAAMEREKAAKNAPAKPAAKPKAVAAPTTPETEDEAERALVFMQIEAVVAEAKERLGKEPPIDRKMNLADATRTRDAYAATLYRQLAARGETPRSIPNQQRGVEPAATEMVAVPL